MNRKLKILALVTDAFGGFGGIAKANQDILSAFSKSDIVEEVLVVPRGAGEKVENLPPKIRQKKPVPNKIFYVFKTFLSHLEQGPFDFIFCGHLHLAPVAALLSWAFRKPFWLHLYGIEAWQRPSWIWQWAAEHADFVTAISRFTRRKFLSWARIDQDAVKVLPCTVGEDCQPGGNSEKLLDRFDLRQKKVLLTVGRLSAREKYKGHDRIIQLLPQLLKQYPDLVYVIVGEGDDQLRLEQLARHFGVKDAIRFMGYLSREDLIRMYQTSDLFVMPSTDEGFGIVYLEALACGLPVLGLNAAGTPDALQDGELGTLVSDSADGHSRMLLSGIQNYGFPLKACGNDNLDLSRKVQSMFGLEVYRNYVQRLLARIEHSAERKA